MVKNKLVDFQQERIKKLENEIKDLRADNKELRKKNRELTDNIDNLRNIHDTVVKEYNDGIEQMRIKTQEVKETMRDAMREKAKYENEMRVLLKRANKDLKRQKLYCSVCGNEIKAEQEELDK